MIRKIKISKSYSINETYCGCKYVTKPYIRIIGNYLSKYNFNVGDVIYVKLEHNKIIITKND